MTNPSNRHFQTNYCKICDKPIVRANWNLYAYKLNGLHGCDYFCSYTCYRKGGGDSGIYNREHFVRSKPGKNKTR